MRHTAVPSVVLLRDVADDQVVAVQLEATATAKVDFVFIVRPGDDWLGVTSWRSALKSRLLAQRHLCVLRH